MNNNHLQQICLLIFLMFFAQKVTAEWIEINGPSYSVSYLKYLDGTLYTAGDGFYFTSKFKEGWKQLAGFPGYPQVIAVINNKLFVGTSEGIFCSDDKGANWSELNSELTNIRAFGQNGNTLFACSKNGVFSSIDNGKNWKKASAGLTDTNVTFLGVISNAVFAGTNNGDFYRLSNDQTTWSLSDHGLPKTNTACIIESNNSVFLGTTNGLFHSEDTGKSWTGIDLEPDSILSIQSLLATDNMLLAGTVAGIFRSTDNGRNWTAANQNNPVKNVSSFIAIKDTVFAGNSDNGVLYSTDLGVTWTMITSGLKKQWVPSIYASGNKVLIATVLGEYFSSDNGNRWTQVDPELEPDVESFGYCEGTIIAATLNGGIHRFNENTLSWSTVISGPVVNDRLSSLAIDGKDIFIGTDSSGMFRTTIDGNGWTEIGLGLPQSRIVALATNDRFLFASTYNPGLFRSSDKGESWVEVSSGLDGRSVLSLAAKGNTIFAGTFNGVYCSDNNGADWKPLNSGIENKYIYYFKINGNDIYAGGHDYLFMSSTNGEQWTRIDSGFNSNLIYSIGVTDKYIFAGTSSYLFRRPLQEIVATFEAKPHQINLIQTSLTLNRNSRNVQINFVLPSTEHVSLKVFNISGQQVASVLNSTLKRGAHTIQWNTQSVAPGYYAIKMNTSSGIYVKSIPIFR